MTYPPPYPYGPPPRKRRTWPIVVAVSALVLLVGTLLITGFVAPGFLLDDEPEARQGDAIDAQQVEAAASDPQALAEATVAALLAKDAAALDQILCADATEDAKSARQIVPLVQHAELEGAATGTSATAATARVKITANGTTTTITQELIAMSGRWCWHGVTADLPEPSPEEKAAVEGARAVAQKFLKALNNGARTAAIDTFCEPPKRFVVRMIERAIAEGADLAITEIPTSTEPVAVLVAGRIGRQAVEGTVMTEESSGRSFCVASFLFQ